MGGRRISRPEEWIAKREGIKHLLLQVMGDFPAMTTLLNPRIVEEKESGGGTGMWIVCLRRAPNDIRQRDGETTLFLLYAGLIFKLPLRQMYRRVRFWPR